MILHLKSLRRRERIKVPEAQKLRKNGVGCRIRFHPTPQIPAPARADRGSGGQKFRKNGVPKPTERAQAPENARTTPAQRLHNTLHNTLREGHTFSTKAEWSHVAFAAQPQRRRNNQRTIDKNTPKLQPTLLNIHSSILILQ